MSLPEIISSNSSAYKTLKKHCQLVDPQAFSLAFIICDHSSQAETVLDHLNRDLEKIKVKLLDFASVSDFHSELKAQTTQTEDFEIIAFTGFEQTATNNGKYPQLFAILNAQRDRYLKEFPFPWLVILPESILRTFIKVAPDFYDYRQSLFRFHSPPAPLPMPSLRSSPKAQQQISVPADQKIQEYLQNLLAKMPSETSSPREAREKAGLHLHLGRLLENQNKYSESLKQYLIAKELLVIHGEKKDVANLFGQCGTLSFRLSEYQQAIDFYQQALDIAKEIGDRAGEGAHLGNLGSVYHSLGQYRQAIDFHQQALDISREIGERASEGDDYGDLGIAHCSLGEYEQALNFCQQALEIAREVGDRVSEGNHSGNLGNVYLCLGQYQTAINLYQQALEIAKEVGDRTSEENQLGNIGSVHLFIGQYRQALGFFQRALNISQEIGDRAGEGNQLGNLGSIYLSLGQYKEALNFCQRSLEIYKKIGDRAGEGRITGNMGNIYLRCGQYQDAINFYQQALVIAKEVGDLTSEEKHLGSIGSVYRSLGQYQLAIKHYKPGLIIAKKIGERAGEGGHLSNLGIVYSSLGQYQQALDFFQQALAIAKEIGDRAGEGNLLGNMGSAYSSLGKKKQAIDSFQQALVIAKEIGDQAGEGAQLGNLGAMHHFLGQHQQAIECHQQALDIAREIGNRAGEGKHLSNLGNVHLSIGEKERALDFFLRSIDVVSSLNLKLSMDFQESFLSTNVNPFFCAIPLLIEKKEYEKAFSLTEEIRVRKLALLIASDSGELPDFPPVTVQKVIENIPADNRTLLLEFFVSNEGTHLFLLNNTGITNVLTIPQLNIDELGTITEEWLKYYQDYKKAYEDYSSAYETYFENGMSDPTIYAETQAAYNKYLSAVKKWQDQISATMKTLSAHLSPCSQLISEQNPERLILIPHLYWHIFPLNALECVHQQKSDSLNEHFELCYCPSSRLMAELAHKNPLHLERPFLWVENPTEDLAFAELEIKRAQKAVFSTLSPQTKTISAKDANSTALKKGFEDSISLFHFSGHGKFEAGNPYDSALFLSNDESFSLNQIFALPRQKQGFLAVLSACETGRQNPCIMDEYISLPAGFLSVGARGVISSLWTVDDCSTALLMERFYLEFFSKKLSWSAALRKAQNWLKNASREEVIKQLELWKQEKDQLSEKTRQKLKDTIEGLKNETTDQPYAHPEHWAAFCFSGFEY